MAHHLIMHEGEAYSPDGKVGPLTPEEVTAINTAQDAQEIAFWKTKPDVFWPAYYKFPAHKGTDALGSGRYTPSPALWKGHYHTGQMEPIKAEDRAVITTFNGSILGYITAARVYRHNFGARMVSISVRGTNGEYYYGRASWDNGDIIKLRRVKC